MANRHLTADSRWLLVLLAALVALGPLSVDMYLPAMPAMRAALDTSVGNIQLTLSVYLAGFALFHLACGIIAPTPDSVKLTKAGDESTMVRLVGMGVDRVSTLKIAIAPRGSRPRVLGTSAAGRERDHSGGLRRFLVSAGLLSCGSAVVIGKW